MMRHLLACAAVFPLMAVSAGAQDFSPHGRIDEFAGVTFAPEATDEVYNLGIGTSLDFPFTDTYGFQVDGTLFMAATTRTNAGAGSGTITAYRRDDSYGIGVFGSALASRGFVVGGGGVVGLLYADDVTYFGSVEFIDGEGSVDPIIGGALGGSYFLTPNTALSGSTSIGFSTGNDDSVLLGVGLGAEHRFDSSPLSVGAAYGFTASTGNGASIAHTAQVNLSYHFGTSSLQDESRTGPSFPGGFSVFNLFGF